MNRLAALVSTVALGIGLAACGGSSGGSTGSTPQPPGTVTDRAVVLTGTTNLGTVLIDSRGRTIYALSSDTTTSTCSGACRSVWPPVTASAAGTPKSSSDVTGALSTNRLSDGTLQVTAAGHPLYTYAGDTGTGQANGQRISSFGGTWHVVSPAGAPVTGSQATPGTTPQASPTSTYSSTY